MPENPETPFTITDEITCRLEACDANDLRVVNAARVSFFSESPAMTPGDEKLIGFLMKNRHGTPFEHGYFTFIVDAPIVVAREHMRHRAGHSYNEMSGRYKEYPPTFYRPFPLRTQTGKPGNYTFEPIADPETQELAEERMAVSFSESWATYKNLLTLGVAKEIARGVLPQYMFTRYFWTCNPRSLMHFIGLRTSEQAMLEIRTVANQAETAFREQMPITHEYFIQNGMVSP